MPGLVTSSFFGGGPWAGSRPGGLPAGAGGMVARPAGSAFLRVQESHDPCAEGYDDCDHDGREQQLQ
jgi:hypothetical protein